MLPTVLVDGCGPAVGQRQVGDMVVQEAGNDLLGIERGVFLRCVEQIQCARGDPPRPAERRFRESAGVRIDPVSAVDLPVRGAGARMQGDRAGVDHVGFLQVLGASCLVGHETGRPANQ